VVAPLAGLSQLEPVFPGRRATSRLPATQDFGKPFAWSRSKKLQNTFATPGVRSKMAYGEPKNANASIDSELTLLYYDGDDLAVATLLA
jgi:hypothetical protein